MNLSNEITKNALNYLYQNLEDIATQVVDYKDLYLIELRRNAINLTIEDYTSLYNTKFTDETKKELYVNLNEKYKTIADKVIAEYELSDNQKNTTKNNSYKYEFGELQEADEIKKKRLKILKEKQDAEIKEVKHQRNLKIAETIIQSLNLFATFVFKALGFVAMVLFGFVFGSCKMKK